ncbi:hypothetical protein B0T17DRAFT_499972 [Bombardia bombarda]|uniref:DUF7779 domain-containing protein n=1 Tax=Bombardia bombarda TaxID=252184 RepID=A0AA39U3L1_9PEZI|nr:hypothetical protein B0T17DRAFT_499972 [Bombardia bombarda]
MSFESLDSHSRAILGVLSFIQPDKIPEALFEPESSTALPASLKFCSDNFLFSPAIENLVTLELIKRDKASRTLSLHRPVQDNFKSSMNPEQRQQAFNDATMLVSTAFPHRDSTVAQLYQMWAGCAVYEPHVIALKDNFKKELVANPKFTVPQAYCIMSNMCQRYLLELRSFEVLADLLDVNTMALATLRESEQTINIQGSLTSHKGQLLTHIGKAEEGVKWLRKSYDIRSRDVPFHPRESAWAADNLAVGFATLNRFEEAAKWHIKARDHFQEWSNHQTERKGEWPAEIMNSMGLGLVWSGQPTPARELMDGALEKVNSVEPYNWAVAASTHFGLGTVERYEGNWDAAEAHFIEAQNLWLQRSRILSDPFNGACLYRLGCTALDKGQPEDAVRYLRDALEVTKKRKTEMVAEHMRGLFKLSEALEQEPRYAEEARATRDEAESLLRQLVPDASNAGKESTYDSLVCILWR